MQVSNTTDVQAGDATKHTSIPTTVTRESHNIPGSQYLLPTDQQEADRYVFNVYRLNVILNNLKIHLPKVEFPTYIIEEGFRGQDLIRSYRG